MAKQVINTGLSANDRRGDPLRTAFTKINSNFDELYNLITVPTNFSGDTIDIPAGGGTSNVEITLDLTKRTHVLKDGWYRLAAGTEGQILYFVPHSTVTDLTTINIRVNNGRYNNGTTVTDFANNFITVFSGQTGTAMATAIYADGAWQFSTGAWD